MKVKTIFLSICVIAACFISTGWMFHKDQNTSTNGIDLNNLLMNAGFEEGDDAGTHPAYWFVETDAAWSHSEWDNSVTHTGERSIKLTPNYYGLDQEALLSQWKPSPITIAGWAKTKDIPSDGDIAIEITYVYAPFTYAGQGVTTITFSNGTHDWEYKQITLYPTKPVDRILIKLYNRSSSGIVWFDDLIARDRLMPSPIFHRRPNKVIIDNNDNLTLNGQPFFPNAIYGQQFWFPGDPDPRIGNQEIINTYGNRFFTPENFEANIERMAKHNFNVAIIYSPSARNIKYQLDIAQKYGMKLIISAAVTQCCDRGIGLGTTQYGVRDLVNTFKDHPALLGWTLWDEPALASLPLIKPFYDLIKKIDPNHIVYMTTGEMPYLYPPVGSTTKDVLQNQFSVTDVLVPDLSSINPPYESKVGVWLDITWQALRDGRISGLPGLNKPKQVWNCFQTWPWNGSPPTVIHYPSAEQQKMISFYAINHKAKGLVQFTYSFCYNYSASYGICKDTWYIPMTAPDLWEGFKYINAEIESLAPVIGSSRKAQGTTVEIQPGPATGGDTMVTTAWDHYNTNYGSFNMLAAGVHLANYDWRMRSLIRFDLSAIPLGNTITEALLEATPSICLGAFQQGGDYETFNAYKVIQPWNKHTVTWSNQPEFDSTIIDSYSNTLQCQYAQWNITKLVQQWYDNTYPNYGLLLKDFWEIAEMKNESDVAVSDNIVKVRNIPLRLYTGKNGMDCAYNSSCPVPSNWGIWLANDIQHTGTNYMTGAIYDWYTGTIYITNTVYLPKGTRILVNYEYSFNSYKYFWSSNYTDHPEERPKLIVTYAPSGYVNEPVVLIDLSESVDSAVIAKDYHGKIYISASNLASIVLQREDWITSPKNIKFYLPQIKEGFVRVLFENRWLPLKGHIFEDTFKENEVHVYELTPIQYEDDSVNR